MNTAGDSSSTRNSFHVIVAYDMNRAIGKAGDLPWAGDSAEARADMAHFRGLTTRQRGSIVIMGRKTYESLPAAALPLSNRGTIVLSRDAEWRAEFDAEHDPDTEHTAESLDDALTVGDDDLPHFVVGGEQLYAEAVRHPKCEGVYATRMLQTFDGVDTHFVALPASLYERQNDLPQGVEQFDANLACRLVYFKRKSNSAAHPEQQYLGLIRKIIDTGVRRGDRTGTGTLSLFGAQMRWDLSETFPLLCTKRVFWSGVAKELLWFVRGSTDANLLKEQGVGIWDGNGTREFLDSRGLVNNRPGDLGPVYGFQWRHFGAEYSGCDADYTGKGIDQLQNIIDTIRSNPTDRRMIICAWNPAALHEMALPPCHMMAQFYVADGALSCLMTQRSCDMGLGVPFNIASYALLTRMIAHITGLRAGELIHSLGDAHVYLNHIGPLLEQLQREPRQFPTLEINARDDLREIDDFRFEDFAISGYKPHKKIAMKMAV